MDRVGLEMRGLLDNSLEGKTESFCFIRTSPSFNEYETLSIYSVLITYDIHNLIRYRL